MENKTHVGFNKKGELTSGKCDAKKGRCPYGNHFSDPSDAHDYLERTSSLVNSLSPELKGYIDEQAKQEGGFSKIPLEVAEAKGFPEEVAKLLAGEPTDPKYARDYVEAEVAKGEPAPLIVESESEFQEGSTKAPKLDLDNPDDVRKMYTILRGYKVSAPEDFDSPPPYILEDIKTLEGEGDVKKDNFVEEYRRFGKTLAKMRLGLTDEISSDDAERVVELTARARYFKEVMRQASAEQGIPVKKTDDDDKWKFVTDYGEDGHELEDRLIQDRLAEMSNGDTYSEFLEARKAINGKLIHREAVRERSERLAAALRAKYGVPPEDPHKPNYDELIKAIGKMEDGDEKLQAQLELTMATEKHSRAVRMYLSELQDTKFRKEAALREQAKLKNQPPTPKAPQSTGTPKWEPSSVSKDKRVISEEYYQSAVKRTREKLMPGAFVMLNGQDAEVYRLDEDGNLRTTSGGVWGRVDYKTGVIIGQDGHEVFTTSGARVYENEAELMQYAALDDSPHDEAGKDSADPGRFSKYEQEPKYKRPFKRVLNFFRRKERAARERAARNREKSLLAGHPTPDAMYKLAVERFEMPPIAKLKGKLDEPGMRTLHNYLDKKIDEGSIRYSSKRQTIVPAKRPNVESFAPTGSPYDTIDGSLPIEVKVSLVNAARRQRDMVTSQADRFAGMFEEKISESNPSAHRRRNWGNAKKMSLREAENGNLLYSKKAKPDGTRDVYVVVDREKGSIAAIRNNKIPVDRLDTTPTSTGINALASEYTIENIEHRHQVEDSSLNVQNVSFEDNDDLELW